MSCAAVAPGHQRATRGAVYVEFVVAFMPLLVFFDCLLQLAELQVARLVTQHAAVAAARAAVVVLHDDPRYYDGAIVGMATGKRKQDIERAAAIVLRAASGIVASEVSYPPAAGGRASRRSFEPDELVRVQVEARYRCGLPLARRIVCNARSGETTLVSEAALPNHGASYVYD